MKTIQVKFNTNPTAYSYIYELDEPIAIGDVAVVDSPISGRLELVTVVGLESTVGATKTIVDRVDVSKYNARIQKAAKIVTLKKELDKRLKLVEASLKYRMLADMDEDAAGMLRELTQLEGKQ
jgi:hypothetical protein